MTSKTGENGRREKWAQAGFSPATRPGSTYSDPETNATKTPDHLPDPDILAQDIIDELETAIE